MQTFLQNDIYKTELSASRCGLQCYLYILVTQFGKNFEDKRVNNESEHQTTAGLNCS